jgi:hypothetical protein
MSFTIDLLTYTIITDTQNVSVKKSTSSISGDIIIPNTVIDPTSQSSYFVTLIEHSAFRDCIELNSITIPNNVTSINTFGFYNCSKLSSVTFLGNNLTSIGDAAFIYCSSLLSITIPSSVTFMSTNVFSRCSKLSSVTFLGNNLTSFSNGLFFSCRSLTSITIPSSITSIGNEVFGLCRSLSSITIPSNVTSIGNSAFEGCSLLNSITIPSSVTSIGNSTFYGCSLLNSITIPSSVTSIGTTCFINIPIISITFLGSSINILNTTIPTGTFPTTTSFIIPNVNFYNDLNTSNLTNKYPIPTYNYKFQSFTSFTAVSSSYSSIILTWNFSNTSIVNNYTITYNYSGGLEQSIPNIDKNLTTFQVNGLTSETLYSFIITANTQQDPVQSSSQNATTDTETLPCFLTDSKVLTDKGLISIQLLKKGDLVQTLNDGLLPVKFVGMRSFFNKLTEERINAHLYKLNKKDFPELLEDLYITGGHPLLVDDKDLDKETKKKLLDMDNIPIITEGKYRVFACVHPKAELWNDEKEYEIFDIVLENDNPNKNYGIWVNGILTESMDEEFFLNQSKMTEINN